MCTPTTSPNTIQVSVSVPSAPVSRRIWLSRHSNDTGVSLTRGTPITRDGSGVSPASWNSSTSGPTAAQLWFIASASGRVARFQPNSPVSSIFRTLSL